jgi:hypothetical protein
VATLALAVIVGALLRLIALDRVPPGLQQDEAMNGIDAFSLGLTGRDHFGHPFPIAGLESYGDWVSPLLTLLSAPLIALVGPQVAALRAVAALVGLLAIPAVYWCGLVLLRRRDLALLAAWLLALAPAHVHLSRFAIPPVTVPTLVPLLLAVAVTALRRGSATWLTAAGALAGVAVLGYPTMKLYVPLLLVVIAAVEWRSIRALPLDRLLTGALAFVVIAGPNLFLSTVDPGGRTRLAQVSAFDGSASGPLIVLAGYLAYLKPSYLFSSGDGIPTHGSPLTGLLLWSLAPLLVMGLARLIAVARRPGDPASRRGAALLLATFVLAPVPGALTVPSPHTLRGSPLIPLGLLVCAMGATPLVDTLVGNWRRPGWRAHGAVALIMLLLLPFTEASVRLGRYFVEYPAIGATAFSSGIAETIAWVAPRAADYDEVWLPFPYNYYLFYQAVPPSEVHVNLAVRRTPGKFDSIPAYGRYHFGTPPPADVAAFAPQTTIRGHGGTARYEIGTASTPDGRRLLVARLVASAPNREP